MRRFLKEFLSAISAMLEALVCHERYWDTLEPTAREKALEEEKRILEEQRRAQEEERKAYEDMLNDPLQATF